MRVRPQPNPNPAARHPTDRPPTHAALSGTQNRLPLKPAGMRVRPQPNPNPAARHPTRLLLTHAALSGTQNRLPLKPAALRVRPPTNPNLAARHLTDRPPNRAVRGLVLDLHPATRVLLLATRFLARRDPTAAVRCRRDPVASPTAPPATRCRQSPPPSTPQCSQHLPAAPS